MPKPNPVRPRMVLKNPIAKHQILEEIDGEGEGEKQWKQERGGEEAAF